MDQTLLYYVVLLIAVGVFAVVLGQILIRRKARKILEDYKALYTDRHQYGQVYSSDFPFLDLAFYDMARDRLSRAGFTKIADLEDLTFSKRFPKACTFYRTMAGDGGATVVTLSHLYYHGSRKRFSCETARSFKIIEFQTELEDGTFIVTSNAHGIEQPGKLTGFVRTLRSQDISLNELLDIHRDKVFEVLRGRGTLTVSHKHLSSVLESFYRAQKLKNELRRSVGYVTETDVRNLYGPLTVMVAGKICTQLDRLKAAQGLATSAELEKSRFELSEEWEEMDDMAEPEPEPAVVAEERDPAKLAKLVEAAVAQFDAEERAYRDGRDMELYWKYFCASLRRAIRSSGVHYQMIVAVPKVGSEIGIARMHGVKPYLCWERPDESGEMENFKPFYLEGQQYDPPFSRIEAIVVGLDHNHVLYVLLEFLEENEGEKKFTLTFDPDWDQPTVLYLGSDLGAAQGKGQPFDTLKSM